MTQIKISSEQHPMLPYWASNKRMLSDASRLAQLMGHDYVDTTPYSTSARRLKTFNQKWTKSPGNGNYTAMA